MSPFRRPALIVALALSATLFSGCGNDEPEEREGVGAGGSAQEPLDRPDTLGEIGSQAADYVNLWALVLSEVEDEESAKKAGQRLDLLAEQFDYLVIRAQDIAPLDAIEFKRVDSEIDSKIARAAAGLEAERKRIFLLPDSIKSEVLPQHETLNKRFRSMSRTIKEMNQAPAAAGK